MGLAGGLTITWLIFSGAWSPLEPAGVHDEHGCSLDCGLPVVAVWFLMWTAPLWGLVGGIFMGWLLGALLYIRGATARTNG